MPPQTGAIKAGSAYVEAWLNDKKFNKGLRRMQRRMRQFGQTLSNIGRTMAMASAAMIAPFLATVKIFAAAGDALHKMSLRTGIAVESLSELSFAAEQSGANIELFENGLRRMQRSILDAKRGLTTALDSFADLGLAVEDLQDLSPEDQFKLIADRIAGIEDPTTRAAVAMMLLGRSGTMLLPLMVKGAAGIEELQQEARDLGLTITTEAANAAAEFTDEMNVFWRVVKRAAFEVGGALVPSIRKLRTRVLEYVQAGIKWVKNNGETIVSTVKLIVKLGALGVAALLVGSAFKGMAAIMVVLPALFKLVIVGADALAVALTFLAGHPAILALILISSAAAAMIVIFRRATTETAKLSNAMTELTARGDRQRRATEIRIKRLEQLAAKEKLTNAEMEETRKLLAQLESKYGDLGMSIDNTTGKVLGLVEGHKLLNRIMGRKALQQINEQIQERHKNIEALNEERLAISQNMDAILDRHKAIAQELIDLRNLLKRRRELIAGEEEALTGPALTKGQKLGADMEKDAAALLALREKGTEAEKQLAQIAERDAARRRTRTEQEIFEIKQIAEERKKLIGILMEAEKVRAGGARPGRIAELEKEAAAVEPRAAEDIEAAKQREVDALAKIEGGKLKQIAEQRLALEESVQDEIDRLRIEGTTKGLARERALLQLSHKRELEDAKELGADLDLLRQKFALEMQMITGGELAEGFEVRGTFAAAALGALGFGGAADPIVEGIDESNQLLARIVKNTQDLGLAYG